jgi:tetratricopeptide (TPR) repeat protein
MGDKERALDSYEQSKEIRGRLLSEKPDDLDMKFQYARSVANFGNLFGNYGAPDKLDTAIKDYEQALALQEDLVRHNSANNEYVNDLAWTLSMLSQLLMDKGQLEQAGSYARRAAERAEEVVSRNPKDVNCLSTLVQSHIARAKSRLHAQPPRPADAAQDLETAEKTLVDLRLRRQYPDDLFDRALVQSLRGDKDEALMSLTEAVHHGYSKIARIRRDSGLEAIRSAPDFKKLVDEIEKRSAIAQPK